MNDQERLAKFEILRTILKLTPRHGLTPRQIIDMVEEAVADYKAFYAENDED